MKENLYLYKWPNYGEFSKHDATCECDEMEIFLQYQHSIIDERPFGTCTLFIYEHPQREFKESKFLEFSCDEEEIDGMVNFDGEEMVIHLVEYG